jgi:hypothetical protein
MSFTAAHIRVDMCGLVFRRFVPGQAGTLRVLMMSEAVRADLSVATSLSKSK